MVFDRVVSNVECINLPNIFCTIISKFKFIPYFDIAAKFRSKSKTALYPELQKIFLHSVSWILDGSRIPTWF